VFARQSGIVSKEKIPAAAMVEKLARQGEKYIELPYTVKGMDLSFSGLLTSATNLLHKNRYRVEDICFSFQETIFSMLTEITERALAHTEKTEILLTGGVAANQRLQSMLGMVAEEHGVRFCYAPKKVALDNGAMIAWTGILSYKKGISIPVEKSHVRLKWRLDEVPIPWVED
jgi:N6-L-threonylcarbamoyladenine synthase